MLCQPCVFPVSSGGVSDTLPMMTGMRHRVRLRNDVYGGTAIDSSGYHGCVVVLMKEAAASRG